LSGVKVFEVQFFIFYEDDGHSVRSFKKGKEQINTAKISYLKLKPAIITRYCFICMPSCYPEIINSLHKAQDTAKHGNFT